jgi:hypothetical protein
MICVNVPVVLGSLLLLFTPPGDRGLESRSTQDECSEVAASAISDAMRVIGDPTYLSINRALLRELGCRKAPTIKRRICQELVQRASQIGSQGTPGYRNIRELMSDMGC